MKNDKKTAVKKTERIAFNEKENEDWGIFQKQNEKAKRVYYKVLNGSGIGKNIIACAEYTNKKGNGIEVHEKDITDYGCW